MSKFKPGDVVEVVDDRFMKSHGIESGMRIVVAETPNHRSADGNLVYLQYVCSGTCDSPGFCGGWYDDHFKLFSGKDKKFVVGDRVRCIYDVGNFQVKVGQVGTVTRAEARGTMRVRLDDDNGEEVSFFPKRFELISSKVEASSSAFTKHDEGKPRMDLLPPIATELEAKCYTVGAVKYGDHNWKRAKPEEHYRYLAAGLRHIFAHMRGERLDPDDKLPHLAHAVCCLKILLELEETTQAKRDEP